MGHVRSNLSGPCQIGHLWSSLVVVGCTMTAAKLAGQRCRHLLLLRLRLIFDPKLAPYCLYAQTS